MRISIANCISTAAEMFKFSTESLFENTGFNDFDYVIVMWLPSEEVEDYVRELQKKFNKLSKSSWKPRVYVVEHKTIEDAGYVPNLRAMINEGLNRAFELNEFAGRVDSDMYFGKNWLKNLVKHANEFDIVNSMHITPIAGPHVVTANLGLPEPKEFNSREFNALYAKLYEDKLETEEERGGWINTATLPYLFHRKWWKQCGPWGLFLEAGAMPPDRLFFQRCHEAGARFTMARDSICYHYEGGERRRMRPIGTQRLPEEGRL